MPTSTDASQRSALRGETPIRPFQPRRTRGFSPMREAGPLTYIALTLAVLVFVFPLYWMFVVATRGNAAIAQRPPALVPGGRTPACSSARSVKRVWSWPLPPFWSLVLVGAAPAATRLGGARSVARPTARALPGSRREPVVGRRGLAGHRLTAKMASARAMARKASLRSVIKRKQ